MFSENISNSCRYDDIKGQNKGRQTITPADTPPKSQNLGHGCRNNGSSVLTRERCAFSLAVRTHKKLTTNAVGGAGADGQLVMGSDGGVPFLVGDESSYLL